MASHGNDENKGPGDVRRTLWPAAHPMTEITRETNNSEQTSDNELVELPSDKEEDLFPDPGTDIKSAQDYHTPIPRWSRDKHLRHGTKNKMVRNSNDGLRMNPVHGFGGSTDGDAPGSFEDPGVTPTKRPQHAVETPRTIKALRTARNVYAGKGNDAKKPGFGAVKVLDYDPSPKHFLAKATASLQTDSSKAIDKPDIERSFSTPPPGFRNDEGIGAQIPDRPHTVKTAPATMFADIDIEEDDSPSIRRQMDRLRIASVPNSGSLERPSGQPAGPRPLGLERPQHYAPISAGGVQITPAKIRGKRSRSEYEKTSSISGRDVTLEREIMRNFAAAAREEEDDADEESSQDEDEDGELTPKASVLNSHMDIDED
ncbi:hypothetical protein CORC01_09401 [Colletotrichum orchidophilum]|uniref:Uncharacterized protein n=1 Tax=Colletotrichum orchidophilum TaxID=1209926 RepID=A0A1G4B1M3_9PEZI|nr:uncharacterized protein CORC01_09401 [Colletotrichum orchidophilum]OHE95256.1 hypothetical protein CORC01_09401 [Colletotrichum orchidophilum]